MEGFFSWLNWYIGMPVMHGSKRISFSHETNIFAPENWWFEDDPFLLGQVGLFSGANLLLFFGGTFQAIFWKSRGTLQHVDPNHTRKGTDKNRRTQNVTPSPVFQEYEYAFLWYKSLEMYQSLIVCPACEMMKWTIFYLFCRNVHLLKPPWTLKKCWVSNRTLFVFRGLYFQVPAVGLGECNFSGFNSTVLGYFY